MPKHLYGILCTIICYANCCASEPQALPRKEPRRLLERSHECHDLNRILYPKNAWEEQPKDPQQEADLQTNKRQKTKH